MAQKILVDAVIHEVWVAEIGDPDLVKISVA